MLPPRPNNAPPQPAQPRPKPVTVDQKLDDIIRRLGHIERHIIDLKGNPPPPGKLRYQYEPDNLRP